MIPVTTFAGRAVAVFGLGASGRAAAQALLAGGATVAAWDDAPEARAAAAAEGIPLADLAAADWSRFAALVLAPGVPLTHPRPHWTVTRAGTAGVEVIGDIELFCRELALFTGGGRRRSDVPLVAVTGTNGKSTTTALIAHILRTAGLDTGMGGNIGTPVLALAPFTSGRHYVVECSSFQIELAPGLRPLAGVLLNVTPDHLDRHGTMAAYAALKERLVRQSCFAAVGVDSETGRDICERERTLRAAGNAGLPPVAVSGCTAVEGGFGADGSTLVFTENGAARPIAGLAGTRSLRGAHNRQNAAAAAAVTLWLLARRFEADGEARAEERACALIQEALRTFPGLAHRLEEAGRRGRVLFVNDSKATNADSTEKALLAWDEGIFWIAGGRAKEGGIASLAPLFPRVAKAYLIGEAAGGFAQTLDSKVPFERAGSLEAAVHAAARDAARSRFPEPVVLLSPACASYDQFRNFEVRGDAFRRLVAALPGAGQQAASPAPAPSSGTGGAT